MSPALNWTLVISCGSPTHSFTVGGIGHSFPLSFISSTGLALLALLSVRASVYVGESAAMKVSKLNLL